MGKGIHKSTERHGIEVVDEKVPSVHSCSIFPKNKSLVSSNWMNLSKTLQLTTSKETKKKKIKFKKKIKNNVMEAAHSKGMPQTSSKNEIWFDNVSEDLLDTATPICSERSRTSVEKNPLIKEGPHKGLTKVIAMDCEMVGTGDHGRESMLARVSIVNSLGYCIYDKYVKPREAVTDYRTSVSGIRQEDLKHGEDFDVVQKEAYDIMKGRTLVGHALRHDLKVLFLDHPRRKIRDTSQFQLFRQISNGRTPSLKKLADHFLGVKVQQGEHSSVQDAQAAMRLYTMHRKKWEKEIRERFAASTAKRHIVKDAGEIKA